MNGANHTMKINGNKVKIMYAELGLTQQQFADLAGMDRTVLSRLLNRGTCRGDMIVRIAKALNIDPLEITQGEPFDEEKET